MSKYVIEIYKTKRGEYAWRLRARRGRKVVADSAETYKRRATCTKIAISIMDNLYLAEIVYL
jgi:uncharacterized protein YegP (UPF0339 family)